jgi:hypothetical protein
VDSSKLGAIVPTAASSAGIAGMWIDDNVYSVAVVSPTEADTALLANLAPAGATVQVFEAKYSVS